MPFNGSGLFQRVRRWVDDAAAGIKIRADYHDAEDDGFAAGISNCIAKDGQSLITQNIPFNSKRITGLADPINPQDAATMAYSDGKLPLTGGTLTGDLSIRKLEPAFYLNSTDTYSNNSMYGMKVDKARWLMRLGNGTDEPGTGNGGSDFDLHSFADDGSTLLARALFFSRATGLGIVAGKPTAPLGIATKKYVDDADAYLQSLIDGKQAALGFTPVEQGGGTGMATNKLRLGWDGLGVRHQVDNNDTLMYLPRSPNPTVPGSLIVNGRLTHAGDIATATGPQGNIYEPWAGAVMTGWSWVIAGGVATAGGWRFRYMQLYSTSWYTVGYA